MSQPVLESRPARVLVIEDNAPDVMLIEESLREQKIPYQLTHFKDGEEAVNHLSEQQELASFDIVILDLNMPRLGGLEVLQKLRENLASSKVPVVVLTSSLAADEQREAKRLGADRYIKKPADLYQFLSEVGGLVRELLEEGRWRNEQTQDTRQ